MIILAGAGIAFIFILAKVLRTQYKQQERPSHVVDRLF